MATNTYVALDKVTVGTATPSITFTGINQGYTDLVLISSVRYTSTNAGQGIGLRFNGDTTTNYSATILEGDGTTASSYRSTNATLGYISAPANGSQSSYTPVITHIQNYTNATTYKTFISRSSGASFVDAYVSLWRATPAAITSLTVLAGGTAGNLDAGSTFSLYGIRAEGTSPAPKATGGAIYSDSTYYYHVFGSTGTFTPLSSLTADILLVGGGGGGSYGQTGIRYGTGGGAGQVLLYSNQSLTATGYTCTVGAGGAGAGSSLDVSGSTGGVSTFTGLTSANGGGGANYNGTGGASGSGNAGVATSWTTASGGSGQGGTPAAPTSNNIGGDGGVGISTYSSWGVATGVGENVNGTYWLAGGGAGSVPYGAGGKGGGGRSLTSNTNIGSPGFANTGGGASGGAYGSYNAPAGGSGVIIVRYAKV